MSLETPALPASMLVVCLCAEWCSVCRDYRSRFLQMQSKFAQAQFHWIDVEDEADLVDPLEVENFPTLLLAVGQEPRFFGPLTPQPEMLDRLIRVQMQDRAAPALTDQRLIDLVTRIRSKTSA